MKLNEFKKGTRFCALIAACLISFTALANPAATWPERSITWVVGYAPGGTTDIIARTVAKKVSEALGQPVVVMNRPGANSNIGAQAVKREDADGYSFYVGTAANTINRSLYDNAGYDILTDFAAVSLFGTVTNLLVVNPALPIKNTQEYIAYAKANPGKLTCGSSGTGSSIHMSCELFKIETGTDIMHVPYSGSGPAMAALLGGQVDSVFDNMPTVMPNVEAGKLRALGVTSPTRWPPTPDIPTLSESGVPGFSVTTWFGLFAPAATDQSIIDRMNKAVNEALKDPATQEILFNRGVNIPDVPNSPLEFSKRVKDDVNKWAAVVKQSGTKVQ